MTLDEAIKYAEEKVSEPSIAEYLRSYKKYLDMKLYELKREKNACEYELENLKEKIKTMSHYESADGQDLVMVSDVGLCIDEYIESAQNKTMCNDCIKKYKCEDEGKNDPAMTFCSGKEKEVDEKP